MKIISSGRIVRVYNKNGNEITEINGLHKPNKYYLYKIIITRGKGVGQVRGISKNDWHSITTSVFWNDKPDATSEYQIIE